MPIVTTTSGKKLLKKAKSLWVIPYVYNSTLNDYVLGQTVYDLSAIIGDSITLEQGDGDTQSKNNEFTNEALVRNITAGEWKITAQCLDLQNGVLKALFAAYYNDTIGAAAMRKDYETLYAMIRVRFADTTTPDVYLPMVQMNSKLLLQQMKTRGSQGNLGGTAKSRKCAIVRTAATSSEAGALYPFTDMIYGTTLYSLDTPVLLLPQTAKILIMHHEDSENGETVYDELLTNISSNQDCCAHNRVVDNDAPSAYTI